MTDAAGSTIISYFGIGNCSVWHNATLTLWPAVGVLFQIDETIDEQVICHTQDPVSVRTPLGEFTVSGTTFGVGYSADGMRVTFYEGRGVVEVPSRAITLRVGTVARAFVPRATPAPGTPLPGTPTAVGAVVISDSDRERIAAIGGRREHPHHHG